MDSALIKALNEFILDPKNHAILAVLKGIRNGIVYGCKVRFPHSLVMTFLFKSGSLREHAQNIYQATRTHATNLASFVAIYKFTMYALANHSSLDGKVYKSGSEPRYHSFLAGLLGGYLVFGRSTGKSYAVSQQIVLYVFARVMLALAKLAVGGTHGPRTLTSQSSKGIFPKTILGKDINDIGWPIFASLSWASVMYMFTWHPETVQPGLRGSMTYLYKDSEKWNNLRNFLLYNK